MKATVSLAVALAALVGCASSPEMLQQATVTTLNGSVAPEHVTILDVDRGATEVHWMATANGRRYRCGADDMVRRPYCVRT